MARGGRDDAASRGLWLDPEHGALAGITPGTLAIESSTLSPDLICELGTQAVSRRVALLEAPVSGSRVQAESGQLVHQLGGDPAAVRNALPVLHALGRSRHRVGPLGDASLVKLATNALLGIEVAALAEIIAVLRRNDVDPDRAIGAIGDTPVWPPVATYLAASMLDGYFRAQFPLALMAKDLTMRLANGSGQAALIAQVQVLFQQALAQGFSEDNMIRAAALTAR